MGTASPFRFSSSSGSPGESHPQAPSEPDGRISTHPALPNQPRPLPQARCLTRQGPPGFPVAPPSHAGWGGPFAPAPLQDLPHYYKPLRPCALHRYSPTHGSAACGSPFASARQVPKFRTRARIVFPPPVCRTPIGQSTGTPRPYPGVTTSPRFRRHSYAFDTSSVVHLRSALRSIPDEVIAPPFPTCLPPRLLNAAAVGGLKPPPARRLRGTYPHLSCSMAARRACALRYAFLAHNRPRSGGPIGRLSD